MSAHEENIGPSLGQKLSGGIAAIATGRSEAQIAQEYRERALKLLDELCMMMTKARQSDGMTVAFQIAGPDGFSRYSLAMLEVSKKLC